MVAWFEASRSIRLSYGRVALIVSFQQESKVTGPIETEVKIPFPAGARDAVFRIEACGYQLLSPRTLETDQVFDRADRSLRREGQLLRLRSAGGKWTLTYKGPASKNPAMLYKSREEIETNFSSFEALVLILERLGYTPSWRYEKYRTAFGPIVDSAGGEMGTIFVDETPIGVYLELEGAESWIDRTAARLGFSAKDYVTLSYAALYQAYLEFHQGPPDMIFPESI
ncbi:MAG TPA: class IV adenylate cyclase [Bryobacteraceae bacterium]|jgi:adenylate cyclase class 2